MDFDAERKLYLSELKESIERVIQSYKPTFWDRKPNQRVLKQRVTEQEKVEAAKELLLKGLHVQEAAEALGFSRARNFSSTFKKITGVTPTEFVKSNAGIIL